MMMLSEIAEALNGQMKGRDVNVQSVGSDSRNIVDGQLFVAIKGDRFDGNGFAAEAIAQGAAAALVSNGELDVNPAVLVDDTRLALGELAHYWRQKFSLPLVAVTGSNGKTTVKEMIAAILSAAGGEVLATKGNLNNDIGMPLTLLNLRTHHQHAVIEMGMNHLGEIRYLTNIAEPHVALVNNAGTAHIGELGSREAIAEAKGEIFEGLVAGGVAVINADDHFADYWHSLVEGKEVITFGLHHEADVSAQYRQESDCMVIDLTTPTGTVGVSLSVLGEHNVSNALAASAVAVALGISNKDIAKALSQFAGVQGRLAMREGYHGAVVIDDTYNANPDSMKAAIDVLAKQQAAENGSTIFVMGDMAEMGTEAKALHAEIGDYAKQQNITHFLSFGEFSESAATAFGDGAAHFSELQHLVDAVVSKMNENVCVLVKGSRSMKMERLVDAIAQPQHIGSAH